MRFRRVVIYGVGFVVYVSGISGISGMSGYDTKKLSKRTAWFSVIDEYLLTHFLYSTCPHYSVVHMYFGCIKPDLMLLDRKSVV